MNVDCERFTSLLLELRHASPEKRRAMDEHTQECSACRRLHRQMQEVETMFADIDFAEPPNGFADRVMASVSAEQDVGGDAAIPALTGVLAVLLVAAYAAQHGVIRLWTDVSSIVAAGVRDWLPSLNHTLDAPVGMVAGMVHRLAAAQASVDWLMVAGALGIVLAFGLGTVYEMSRRDHGRLYYR